MELQEIQSRFQLSDEAIKQVETYKKTYSKPLSLSTLWNKISNALRSLFGQSDWQRAKKTLHKKSIEVINSRFSEATNKKEQSKKAQALSEYILHRLVQTNPEELFFENPDRSLQLEEIIDRASFGDGKTLPELENATTLDFIQRAYRQLEKTVDGLERHLERLQVQTPAQTEELYRLVSDFLSHQPKQSTEQNLPQQVVSVVKNARDTLTANQWMTLPEKKELIIRNNGKSTLRGILNDFRQKNLFLTRLATALEIPVQPLIG